MGWKVTKRLIRSCLHIRRNIGACQGWLHCSHSFYPWQESDFCYCGSLSAKKISSCEWISPQSRRLPVHFRVISIWAMSIFNSLSVFGNTTLLLVTLHSWRLKFSIAFVVWISVLTDCADTWNRWIVPPSVPARMLEFSGIWCPTLRQNSQAHKAPFLHRLHRKPFLICHKSFYIFVWNIFCTVPYLMNNTLLNLCFRIYRRYSLRETG